MKAIISLVFITLFLTSCGPGLKIVVPLSPQAKVEDTYTIIWNGTSEAYRYVEGEWQRDSTYDYVFDVVQKRYPKQWKSVKNLHRLHPDYDGRAGQRSQAMYFELNYQRREQDIQALISSSLGKGQGTSDREFREQVLEFELVGLSSFSPYTHMRIHQSYRYEAGLLEELVELYRIEDGQEVPFMKNHERAWIYTKSQLEGAPTRM